MLIMDHTPPGRNVAYHASYIYKTWNTTPCKLMICTGLIQWVPPSCRRGCDRVGEPEMRFIVWDSIEVRFWLRMKMWCDLDMGPWKAGSVSPVWGGLASCLHAEPDLGSHFSVDSWPIIIRWFEESGVDHASIASSYPCMYFAYCGFLVIRTPCKRPADQVRIIK